MNNDGKETSVGIGINCFHQYIWYHGRRPLKRLKVLHSCPPDKQSLNLDAGRFTEGAMIFNTTTKKLEFCNGTSWSSLPGMSLGLTVALDG